MPAVLRPPILGLQQDGGAGGEGGEKPGNSADHAKISSVFPRALSKKPPGNEHGTGPSPASLAETPTPSPKRDRGRARRRPEKGFLSRSVPTECDPHGHGSRNPHRGKRRATPPAPPPAPSPLAKMPCQHSIALGRILVRVRLRRILARTRGRRRGRISRSHQGRRLRARRPSRRRAPGLCVFVPTVVRLGRVPT